MRSPRRRFLQQFAALSALSGGIAWANRFVPLQAEQQFLTSAKLGGFDLFYEVHGEGPAVVFAHGSGGTHMSWWQQVPVLSARYRCITIDQRAFGYSKDVANGPGRRAFVQDLEGLLDRLKVGRVALVGQSMGGSTVLPFAAKHPERVSALVLADTTGGYTDPEIDGLRKQLGSTRSAFAPGFAAREPALAFLYREISALTLDAVPAEGSSASTPAPAAPAVDIRPVVAAKVPTLFLVGEQDVLIPPPIIEAMHRKMPGSRLVKVPGAGHSVYFEKAADFNRIVGEFLNQHARG